MNISTDAVVAGCAVITLVGVAVGIYLALVDRRQSQEMNAIIDSAKETKETLEKRLDGLHEYATTHAREVEQDRRALEHRIGELEKKAITRADHADFRAEILLTVDKVGDRIEKSLDKFTTEIKQDMRSLDVRISSVEGRG